VKREAILFAALVSHVAGCSESILDAVGLPPQVLTDGMVAHWALDESSGTLVSDRSGNRHDGQLTGGTWVSDGRFGGALRLATGGAVAVPGLPAPTPNWSVSVWLRMSGEQLASSASDLFTTVVSTENFRSAGWQINVDKRLTQARYVFSYWSPPLMDYIGVECSCVETGVWVHLAATVDTNTNRVSLYLNGTFADQQTRPSDIVAGDSTLYFGRWNRDGRLLNGDLDDVAIWARALTPEEISALATQSPP
jgi:hypothetical protein